jgi:hypothetical protein
MELALGALLNGVEGDFVETGVRAGGTAILLCKVLERCDPGGQRVLWAADSFQVREGLTGVPSAGGVRQKAHLGCGSRSTYCVTPYRQLRSSWTEAATAVNPVEP